MKTLYPAVAVCSVLVGSFVTRPACANVFNMPAGQTSCQLVTVGDPGNAASGGWGAVSYPYQMGKYDVTAAQYCQFLSDVASTDTYGLYNPNMANPSSSGPWNVGCGIVRGGGSGSYTYSVTAGRENMPVNWVSWGDAVRFANWLSHGQPSGAEGNATTETGSYTLNGAMTDAALMGITRNPGATYVLPSWNEWYKAAFYKGGSTQAGYWLYPTRSNTAPSPVLSGTGTNNANFAAGIYPNVTYTDPVNYLTPVGLFAGSPGPYGTFDMGGNVCQWNDTAVTSVTRGMGGSVYCGGACTMQSTQMPGTSPSYECDGYGFRVAAVPEPATLSLLALGGLLIARRHRA